MSSVDSNKDKDTKKANIKDMKRSLLSGALEFKMMHHMFTSHDSIKNCWSRIAQQLGVPYSSIVKNTFYSKANTYLKKVANYTPIKLNNEEERAKMSFYLLSAIDCLKGNYQTLHKKANYFETMISEFNLTVPLITQYALGFGISLDSSALEMTLKYIANTYSSNEIAHSISLPHVVYVPIDYNKNLKAPVENLKSSDSFDIDLKSSILFFLKFPRASNCQCIFQEPNMLMDKSECSSHSKHH